MLEMIRIKRKPNIYQIKSIRVGSLAAEKMGVLQERVIEEN